MSVGSRRQGVMMDFIRVIGKMADYYNDQQRFASVIRAFLAIMDDDDITEYSALITSFRKYINHPNPTDLDKCFQSIEKIYNDLSYHYYQFHEKGGYRFFDRDNDEISPEFIRDCLDSYGK